MGESTISESKALQTDLYELTMAAGYFENNVNARAVFELFCYRLPKNRSYLIAAGLKQIVDYLVNIRFTDDEIRYLKNHRAFASVSRKFFDHLKHFRFTGNLWALREGEVFFAQEPVLQIEAPILEAQILETYLLSSIHIQTLVASKASRIIQAADPSKNNVSVVDFGSRRAHGSEAAIYAARAAYLAGCSGTSNVFAGKQFGIPTYGTMAHSWVEAFDSEQESFRKYLEAFPEQGILLIDTFDTLEAARQLKSIRKPIKAVRLDSGDLLALSKTVRKILNRQGLSQVKIIASGNLNEDKIRALLQQKAPIDVFGVGTEMVISKDHPSLDLVYKLVQTQDAKGQVILKTKGSEGKTYYPKRKQVFRHISRGKLAKDIIGCADEKAPAKTKPLLQAVIKNGKLIKKMPALQDVRTYCQRSVNQLPMTYRSIGSSKTYRVLPSSRLKQAQREYKKQVRALARKCALLIVDVQNDFCPGGKLAVRKGDQIISPLNDAIKIFRQYHYPIIASRDWHPKKTSHFEKFGGNWPQHCIRNTKGARFHPHLCLPPETIIISKGMNPEQDSYSAFHGKDANGHSLGDLLNQKDIQELFIAGIATDYCVKHSALDALKKGFKVYLLSNAVKGVRLKDSMQALREMQQAGAVRLTGRQLRGQIESGKRNDEKSHKH